MANPKIVLVDGVPYEVLEDRQGKKLRGYTVHFRGQQVGNRIERIQPKGGGAHFRAIARNELSMGLKPELTTAVADVVREGMRDRRH